MENKNIQMKAIFKKLTALLMVAVMLICAAPLSGVAELDFSVITLGVRASNSDFSGGSGTEEDPYLIETIQQLDEVRNNLNAHFKLICDIEFSDVDFSVGGDYYNNSSGWKPIGDEDDSFEGVFDGNGYSIKNLYIQNTGEKAVGLFGYNEGIIKNLSIVDAYVYACGQVSSPYYSATVYIGSIVGYSTGNVSNCCSFGKVYATAVNPGTPTSSTSARAYIYAGGIVGFNGGFEGVIENCYNNSSVTIKSPFQPYPCAGGIVGSSNGSIKNSYNIGDVSAASSGGIVGECRNTLTSVNCYYSDNVLKGVGSGTDIFIKCTLSSMSKAETFDGFDFTSVWTFDSRYGYIFPILRNGYRPNLVNTEDFLDGCGTEERPFLIETKEHLNNIRKFPKAYYKLISDIVFTTSDFSSGGSFHNNGDGWEPIGSSEEPFSGFFDGNGHSIKGLYINTTGYYVVYAGLFGYNKGIIQNLGMVDCNITAKNTSSSSSAAIAGSIAADCSGIGKIINCNNSGNITAYSHYIAYAGGIVGMGGDIEKCYNEGCVTATAYSSDYSVSTCSAYAGGIVGRGGSVRICYNVGCIKGSAKSLYDSVSAKSSIGGIAGQGWDIFDSFNIGTISSTTSFEANVGGICGYSEDISNCYNVGDITSTATTIYSTLYTGGVAGNLYSGTMINCYYLDSINVGEGFGVIQNTKCTSCEMLKASTYSGFDFNEIWIINKDDLFPLPRFQSIDADITLIDSSKVEHIISGWIVDKDSTCVQEGGKHKECKKCNEILEIESIPPKNHEETQLIGKEPTCTNSGLSEGKFCSACNTILVLQTEIPATGHSHKATVTAPTCTAAGYTTYTCSCGDTYVTEKVNALTHKDNNGDYKCDYRCGYEFPKPEPTTVPTTVPSTTQPTTVAPTPQAPVTTAPTQPTTVPVTTIPITQAPTTTVAPTTQAPATTAPTTVPSTTQPTTQAPVEATTAPTTAPTTQPTTEPTTVPSTMVHTHTEVVIPAVAATYKEAGLTEGKKCSECGEILVAQKKVARKKLKKVSGVKTKSVKLASGTKSTLTLSWSKVTGAEKYVVQQYVNKKWKTVATTKKTSYTVKKLKANKSYKFRVRAAAGNYFGSYSKAYTAKTIPLKPTLTVKAGKKQLTASWKTVANITGYEVQYSTSKKFTKKTTKTSEITKAKTIKKTIKSLKKGKKYYVRVRAYKTVNGKKVYGSYSSVKTVKVK